MAVDRRTFLGAALAALAGCSRSDPPGTPTPDAPAAPEDYLPEPGGGWRLERTGEHDWRPLGGTDGVLCFYAGPDGGRYGVVVMFADAATAEGTARSWACAGWQVALALDGVAVAASTGTDQRTFTPERPPTMTASPDPDRRDRVLALLSRSPRLTETDVEKRRVECR